MNKDVSTVCLSKLKVTLGATFLALALAPSAHAQTSAPTKSSPLAQAGSHFSELLKGLGSDSALSTSWLNPAKDKIKDLTAKEDKEGVSAASVSSSVSSSKASSASVFDELTKLASTTVQAKHSSGVALIDSDNLKNGLYANHPSLRSGSLIRVTNLKTKQSMVLEVAQSFDAKANQVVQLSPKAAQLLSLGTASSVSVEQVLLP